MFKNSLKFKFFSIVLVALVGCAKDDIFILSDGIGSVKYNSVPAIVGLKLLTNDEITTEEDSFARITFGKTEIYMFPDATLKILNIDKAEMQLQKGEIIVSKGSGKKLIIFNDYIHYNVPLKSCASFFRQDDYLKVILLNKDMKGLNKEIIRAGFITRYYLEKTIDSVPADIGDSNRINSILSIRNISELSNYYHKPGVKNQSTLAKLAIQNGPLNIIITKDGKTFIGYMIVSGNNILIKTGSDEVKIKNNDVLSVQRYDKF